MESVPDGDPASEGHKDPMLDVHPPHAAIHGWRDFFIHIATITIGLLIAIGLEQTVEYVHHREQLSDARRHGTAATRRLVLSYRVSRLVKFRFASCP
jgi:hypothetical protein